jgi:hypothetical protein
MIPAHGMRHVSTRFRRNYAIQRRLGWRQIVAASEPGWPGRPESSVPEERNPHGSLPVTDALNAGAVS